jgi:pimeloyl-ACP methyl ester carboxylesterase
MCRQSSLYTRYRSMLVDLPGHGESEKPQIDNYHESFARSVKAVLDLDGISHALFVAHSMGGLVVRMISWLFPETVTGMVYLGSFWRISESYLSNMEKETSLYNGVPTVSISRPNLRKCSRARPQQLQRTPHFQQFWRR